MTIGIIFLTVIILIGVKVNFDYSKLYTPYCEHCGSKNLKEKKENTLYTKIKITYICNDCNKEVWDDHCGAG
jgi:DNA-directed RNA polymerase subunit RPC12/RpoP